MGVDLLKVVCTREVQKMCTSRTARDAQDQISLKATGGNETVFRIQDFVSWWRQTILKRVQTIGDLRFHRSVKALPLEKQTRHNVNSIQNLRSMTTSVQQNMPTHWEPELARVRSEP